MGRGPLVVLGSLVLMAAAAPWLAHVDPAMVRLERILEPPGSRAWMGTDALGRDLLARCLYGARVSLLVAAVATVASLALGTLVGAGAALRGGRTDEVALRVIDFLSGLPFLFLAIALVALLDDAPWLPWDAGRLGLFLALMAGLFWMPTARLVRSETLSLRESAFVAAARAQGTHGPRLLVGHILPHLLPTITAAAVLTAPRALVFEATLSFLGLGVEPPDVSWGLLAAEGVETLNPVHVPWWLVAGPGALLVITLLALQAAGTAVQKRAGVSAGTGRETGGYA